MSTPDERSVYSRLVINPDVSLRAFVNKEGYDERHKAIDYLTHLVSRSDIVTVEIVDGVLQTTILAALLDLLESRPEVTDYRPELPSDNS